METEFSRIKRVFFCMVLFCATFNWFWGMNLSFSNNLYEILFELVLFYIMLYHI